MAKDMRTQINQLEEAGELLRVSDNVSIELDIGRCVFESKEKALPEKGKDGLFDEWVALSALHHKCWASHRWDTGDLDKA